MLLLFAIVLAVWAGVLLERFVFNRQTLINDVEALAADSIALETFYAHRTTTSSGPTQQQVPEEPVREVETFAFDPNTADSFVLQRLGLAPWQVRSIYHYRAKGGRYHRAEDFQRVPGMTPEVWNRLAPVIQIGEAFRLYSDLRAERHDTTRAKADTNTTVYQEKFKEIVQLDLNLVDSSSLKMIPGIASVRARRILRYRDQLGGFVSLEQLSEIADLPEGIEKWFTVQTGVLRPLLINKLTTAELARHPYLNYAQAKAITSYRRNYGNLRELSELRLCQEFTEDDFRRLEPYVKY